MAEQLRANNESFLQSSIYETAKAENREVNPYKYSFNRSSVPMAIDHSNEVQFNSPAFSSTMNVEIPRKGFSNGGFIKITTAKPANATVSSIVNDFLNYGFVEAINTLKLKTRKEVLYTHNANSIIAWLDSRPDQELRNFYKLVLCQGISDSAGTAIANTTAEDAIFYIPMELFPIFNDKQQAVDLNFSEPLTVELSLNAALDIQHVGRSDPAVAAEPTMTSIVLNTSHGILDTDAYNEVLKMYQSVPRSQKISHDWYENTNTLALTGTTEGNMKLEGMGNVVKLYVMCKSNSNVLQDILSVKLKSGNKTIVEYNGVEVKLMSYNGMKKQNYKDSRVVELSFSLSDDDHALSGSSYGGALSVRNLIDPRIYVSAAATSTCYVVAKQLSTLQLQHSSGTLSLGASS